MKAENVPPGKEAWRRAGGGGGGVGRAADHRSPGSRPRAAVMVGPICA